MAIVYQHISLDTQEVFYVGVGVTQKRAYATSGRNKYWTNVTNKTEYRVEVLQEGLTWEEARQEEIRLIAQYGRKDLGKGPLVNMTDGGDGSLGVIKSEEIKHALKKKMAGKGLGRKLPPKTIQKMRTAKLGKVLSPEHNRNKALGLKNSNKSNAKKIQHVASGVIYKGGVYAAEAFGIHTTTLAYRLKKGEFIYLPD